MGDLPGGLENRLVDLFEPAGARRIGRDGELGPYFYQLHGVVCRLTAVDGTVVDVDFAADGVAVFDLWCLRLHGESRPDPVRATDEELRCAVAGLAELLTEVRPGWYTVTAGTAD
ncbi:DUF6896 domain-containing protein [Kitasatospora camelliae]|uniref:DUF6896 domain-containing protein n=1 Tax=Kitasatospora camelliae TaxID=3156397 RepID=A0AAU8JP20_9ACTN